MEDATKDKGGFKEYYEAYNFVKSQLLNLLQYTFSPELHEQFQSIVKVEGRDKKGEGDVPQHDREDFLYRLSNELQTAKLSEDDMPWKKTKGYSDLITLLARERKGGFNPKDRFKTISMATEAAGARSRQIKNFNENVEFVLSVHNMLRKMFKSHFTKEGKKIKREDSAALALTNRPAKGPGGEIIMPQDKEISSKVQK